MTPVKHKQRFNRAHLLNSHAKTPRRKENFGILSVFATMREAKSVQS
jgi:hypothetical protein